MVERGGFIQFKRVDNGLPAVVFADTPYVDTAIEITGPEDLPAQWVKGHEWGELDIMPEAYLEEINGQLRLNLRILHAFIREFGFKPGDPMFMNVFLSSLDADSQE